MTTLRNTAIAARQIFHMLLGSPKTLSVNRHHTLFSSDPIGRLISNYSISYLVHIPQPNRLHTEKKKENRMRGIVNRSEKNNKDKK